MHLLKLYQNSTVPLPQNGIWSFISRKRLSKYSIFIQNNQAIRKTQLASQLSDCGFLGIEQSRRCQTLGIISRQSDNKHFFSFPNIFRFAEQNKPDVTHGHDLKEVKYPPASKRTWKVKTPSIKLQNTCILAIMLKFSSIIIISNPNLQRRNYSMPEKPQPLICEAILVFLIAW